MFLKAQRSRPRPIPSLLARGVASAPMFGRSRPRPIPSLLASGVASAPMFGRSRPRPIPSLLTRAFGSMPAAWPVEKIRNVAIIAHVDHGKTTLVNQMLQQATGSFQGSLDCNDLESERGITILSKATRLLYRDFVLNIVDTPGHADFGGEVERVISMVDGVVLVVDLGEGPKTQTRFVLQKALNVPHVKPLVVVNKADRHSDRGQHDIDNEIFDLFCALEANDSQMDYSTIYGSAKEGWCVTDYAHLRLPEKRKPLTCILDRIIEDIPSPKELKNDGKGAFSMLSTTLDYISQHGLGLTVSGKVYSGTLRKGDKLLVKRRDGKVVGASKVKDVTVVKGLERESLPLAGAGDIVSVSLIEREVLPEITDTLCSDESVAPLPSIPIDPPVVSIKITYNTSPIAGKDGKNPTNEALAKRLKKEAQFNAGIEAIESANKDSMEVRGRGELQLAILVEQMKREGFEMTLSPPSVICKTLEDGTVLEPWEEVQVIASNTEAAKISEKMASRGAEIVNMVQVSQASAEEGGEPLMNLVMLTSTRCFAGMRAFIREVTQSRGVITSAFKEYRKKGPPLPYERRPVIISNDSGTATAYSIDHMLRHGKSFVNENDRVYAGMIVGEARSGNELVVAIAKPKPLDNTRKKCKEGGISVPAVKPVTIESALAYIQDDEQIEVTPLRVVMRKKLLCPNARKQASKERAKEIAKGG